MNASTAASKYLSSRACIVGMDLGGTNLRLLLADAAGVPIDRANRSIHSGSTPREIAATVQEHIHELMAKANLPISCLRGIGAGIPGITNAETGVVKAASFLSDWRDVPFRTILEQELQVPVFLENDVNLAAYGEMTAGNARDAHDFIFLAIGTGFGAGVVLNGKLYQGATWSAGEVGHLRTCASCYPFQGLAGAGSLESLIGGPALEQAWRDAVAPANEPYELSATAIFERAGTGSALAMHLLDRTASLLADAIANIFFLLNPSLFVLGGGVGSSEILREAVLRKLQIDSSFILPRVEISSLGRDAQLIGATLFAAHRLQLLEE